MFYNLDYAHKFKDNIWLYNLDYTHRLKDNIWLRPSRLSL